MSLSAVNNLLNFNNYGVNSGSSAVESKNNTFDDLFQAAMNMVNKTNQYSKAAQEQETAYSLGLTDDPANLLIAQQKANVTLQYTVAIRNHVLDAYKEIMNLQF
jgi:flagellar hook-basal body complex protein FliE